MKLARLSNGNGILGNDFGRVLDRFFSPDLFEGASFTDAWVPSMDVVENDNEYLLSLELPGLDKSDVKITYSDGQIAIEGERKFEDEKKEANYHRVERRYGKFRRVFQLPDDIKTDKIDASFNNGVLSVSLPKLETVKPKQIEVKIS